MSRYPRKAKRLRRHDSRLSQPEKAFPGTAGFLSQNCIKNTDCEAPPPILPVSLPLVRGRCTAGADE